MRCAWLWALALLLLALLPARLAFAQCTKDTECKGERICNAGACEAPSGAAPAPFNEPAPEPVLYRRNSTAMMVTGIVASSLGVASLATALGLGIASVDCKSKLDDEDSSLPDSSRTDPETCRGYSTAADVTVISGLVLTGAGIPLLVIGARKVPVTAEAQFSPWVSRQGAGLSLRLTL